MMANSVIGLLARDRFDRVLLQLRDDFEGVLGGGKWALFGGEVEENESLDGALMREISEEIGLEFARADLSPFAKSFDAAKNRKIFCAAARAPIKGEHIRLREGAGFAFFNPRQLEKIDIIPSLAPIILAFAKSP